MTGAPCRIVVGIDRTPHSRDALALAEALLGDRPGSLEVAHIHGALPRDAAEAWLEHAMSGLRVPAKGHAIAAPSPANALHDLARQTGAAMIVVGSSHRGPHRRAFLGDNGARTVHDAPCPVALATSGWASSPVLEVAGVAYDGSAEARLAVAQAEILARATGARVRLVHVATRVWGSSAFEAVTAGVSSMERPVALLGARGAGEVRHGDPVKQLAEACRTVDVMVVGSRSRGVLERVLGGSTSMGLMRTATCPVVITPRGSGFALRPVAIGAADPVTARSLR